MLSVCKNAASAVIKTAKPAVNLAKLNNVSYKLIPAAYNRKYHHLISALLESKLNLMVL